MIQSLRRISISSLTKKKHIMSQSPKKSRKHIKIEVENVQTPENWETLYNNILEMRKEKTAPVDTMGCEKVQELSSDPKVCSPLSNLNLLSTL